MGGKFYMYYDDIKKELYISLPMEKIVVKLDPSKNPILIDQVAGTGEHCKGNNPCGDNGKAVEAQLTYPKVCTTALFRNNRFALNKMFQRNASKFAIFYV